MPVQAPDTADAPEYLQRIARLVEPVSEAAARLGCSRQYVRQLIGAGRLEAVRLGHDYFVSALSLQEFLDRRRADRTHADRTHADKKAARAPSL